MKNVTVLLLGMLLCAAAQADPRIWGDEGIPIRAGLHLKWDGGMARDADGNTLLVWSDQRLHNRDIRAQLINSTGESQWADEGVNLSPEPHVQDAPVAVAVNGGWIVAWVDYRGGVLSPWPGPYSDVYVQKLDYAGNRLWSANDWTGVDLNIDDRWAYRGTLRIVHDGQGGAIIAWEDLTDYSFHIMAQRISSNGLAVWDAPLNVPSDSLYIERFEADSTGDGGMIITWSRWYSGTYYDVYAARINPDGTLPWGPAGAPVCVLPNYDESPQIIADGTGGSYVVWEHNGAGGHRNIYAQRLNVQGAPMWQENGIPVTADPIDVEFHSVELALDWNDGLPQGFLVAWQDYRDPSGSDVYAQKVTATGTTVWVENGVQISTDLAQNYNSDPIITTDHNGGVVCAWERRGSSQQLDQLVGVRLDENGEAAWQEGGVPLRPPRRYLWSEAIIGGSFGTYFVAYFDRDSIGTESIRYQLLNHSDGSLLLEADGREVIAGIGGYATDQRTIAMSDHRTTIVWEDGRAQQGGTALYYQIIGPFGETERRFNGEMLAPNNTGHVQYGQFNFRVCEDGSGGFFVSFEDRRLNIFVIRASHVNHLGEVISPDSGVVVWGPPGSYNDQFDSQIAPDGEGGCYVAWTGYTHQFWIDMWVMRLDAQLQRVWDDPVRLTNSPTDDLVRDIVAADGGCMIVWQSGDYGDFNVSAARINADGSVSWNWEICYAPNDQDYVVAVSDGAGGAYLAWSDMRDPQTYRDLYAQHIGPDGNSLWGGDNGIPIYAGDQNQWTSDIVVDTRGDVIILWTDFRDGSAPRPYAQKLSPSGELRWDADGVPVATDAVLNEYSSVAMAASERDGFFAVWSTNDWEDARLRGTHLDSTGVVNDDPYWQPDSGGAVADLMEGYQQDPSAVTDGFGGCVTAWQQYSFDYFEGDEGHGYFIDLYAQRLFDYESDVEKPGDLLPREYALHQNYPNPFNPTTSIAFDLPQANDVELKVFDLLGREVMTLLSQRLVAGSHAVNFDASGLPSGLYIYRINAGSFSASRKLVILK